MKLKRFLHLINVYNAGKVLQFELHISSFPIKIFFYVLLACMLPSIKLTLRENKLISLEFDRCPSFIPVSVSILSEIISKDYLRQASEALDGSLSTEKFKSFVTVSSCSSFTYFSEYSSQSFLPRFKFSNWYNIYWRRSKRVRFYLIYRLPSIIVDIMIVGILKCCWLTMPRIWLFLLMPYMLEAFPPGNVLFISNS